jgi:hypothetical protein
MIGEHNIQSLMMSSGPTQHRRILSNIFHPIRSVDYIHRGITSCAAASARVSSTVSPPKTASISSADTSSAGNDDDDDDGANDEDAAAAFRPDDDEDGADECVRSCGADDDERHRSSDRRSGSELPLPLLRVPPVPRRDESSY